MKRPSSTSRSAAASNSAWVGFAAVLLVRLAVFPFAKNFYGDPMMRLGALTAWMAHPYFFKSFIGAKQFGPLHLYLLALGQWIHRDLDNGPRLISLAFGALTAFPLFRLAERRFGPKAALLSTLGLAVYPLHIQASTTAASEAVFLWFLMWALALLDEVRLGAPTRARSEAAATPRTNSGAHWWARSEAAATPRTNSGARWSGPELPVLGAGEGFGALILAGLAMAGACAVRYDGWLYAPLSWLWLVEPLRARRISATAVAGYVALSLAVPVFLCVGNWIDLDAPFYVLQYVQQNHVQSAAQAAAAMGRWTYAGYCLLFWPANLAWELSPPIAIGIGVAAAAALREHRHRDLLGLAAIPAVIFSLEGALVRFHPLARFTMPAALLLLPYAGDGLLRIARSLPRRLEPALAALAIFTGIGLPSYFAWRTLGRGDSFADTLRPISPVSNLPPDLMAAADWIKVNGADRKVEVETNWLYEELPIEFYGQGTAAMVYSPRDGLPPKGFEPPDLMVLPKESDLLRTGQAHLDGESLESDGQRFLPLAHLGRVTIFERCSSSFGPCAGRQRTQAMSKD